MHALANLSSVCINNIRSKLKRKLDLSRKRLISCVIVLNSKGLSQVEGCMGRKKRKLILSSLPFK